MELTPDTRLTRADLAEKLTAIGYPIKAWTLATLASRPGRGGGPPYTRFGNATLYQWGDALAWAKTREGAPRRSTSEADAAQRAV